MHGLFSIPLNVFISMVSPPDPASLQNLEKGLDRIARDFELSDRETRTLKDSFVEPFRQEGMPLGPDTVEWMHLLNRRLLALPPGIVAAGAELQWNTLGLSRYARGVTLQQYLQGLSRGEAAATQSEPAAAAAAPAGGKARKPRKARRKV